MFDDDSVRDEYITEDTLTRFLMKCDVHVSPLEARLLTKVFDKDRDGVI